MILNVGTGVTNGASYLSKTEAAMQAAAAARRGSVPDRPGQLGRTLTAVGALGGNVVTVFHQREGRPGLGILETEIDLTILARDQQHGDEIVASIEALGGGVQRLA